MDWPPVPDDPIYDEEYLTMNTEETKKDYRIGLSVKAKYRTADFYYDRGVVVEVYPSGTGGIVDPDGVIAVKHDSGIVRLHGADALVTAQRGSMATAEVRDKNGKLVFSITCTKEAKQHWEKVCFDIQSEYIKAQKNVMLAAKGNEDD